MKAPARKFWTRAEAREGEGGWIVALDDRPLRTPLGVPFAAPWRAVAEAAAAEWEAQSEAPDPQTMPVTRTVNTAIDRAGPEYDVVADMIAAYGESDLLCYRAPGPGSLVARQAEGWDPLLAWAEGTLGARLICGEGVVPVSQPPEALAALSAAVRRRGSFELTALHDLVVLSGALVLGRAVAEGAVAAEDAWRLSRIDEDFQAERWGEDAEAAAAAERRRGDFLFARRFLSLLSQ